MVRLADFVHVAEVGFLLGLLIMAGTVGFMVLEGLPPLEALHLTIQTITTVGYGSPTIETSAGRMFSNGLMLFGVGIALYAFWILMDLSVGGHIRRTLGRHSYRKELMGMKRHVIVCGYDRVGQAAGERLQASGREFVVICKSEEDLQQLPESVPRLFGDATEEETLKEAGIERADTVLIAFGDDSDTILTIVTAKALNPDARIIARASHKENTRKMVTVGATEVVVPEVVGGRRMADHAARPEEKAGVLA